MEVKASRRRSPFCVMPHLIVVGQFMMLDDDTRWTMIECTDFNMLNLFESGADIDSVVSQRRDVGFNTIRVGTSFNVAGIGRLIPKERPSLYDCIPHFIDYCHQREIRVELIGFMGPYDAIFANDNEKIEHWNRIKEIQTDLLEMVNEFNHLANSDLPFDLLDNNTSNIVSHGSGTSEHYPCQPYWDYAGMHFNTAYEWQRKCAHNPMSDVANVHNIPCNAGENPRFPDNEDSVIHAYDAARGAALLHMGSCFHSVHGKTSELWEGIELDCAKAWADGAKSIPLRFQLGSYHRRDDLLTPELLRVYERSLQYETCIVEIRK